MTKRPMILVTAGVATCGEEFSDLSVSLSDRYQIALVEAGGLPLILPSTVDPDVIAESVRRSDGVMLTGGEDVEPRLYTDGMDTSLRKLVNPTPDGGRRDFR